MTTTDSADLNDELVSFLRAYDEAVVEGRPTEPLVREAVDRFGPDCLKLFDTIAELYSTGFRAEAGTDTVSLPSDQSDEDQNWKIAPSINRYFGRFRILYRLGSGGGGIVFRAYDLRLNRDVALKLPSPGAFLSEVAAKRFFREAQMASTLYHPNIVPVHDAGQVGDVRYMVSAFCDGPNLAEYLRRRKADGSSFPISQATEWVATLADAVAYAHCQGIVHRDLKPSNILLEHHASATAGADAETQTDGLHNLVLRITDFGIAKLLTDDGTMTATGTILGTPQYMAPEQADGRQNRIDSRTDVFALGAILYELLTGRPPIEGKSSVDILRRIPSEEPIAPRRLRSEIPVDLEAICLKCLEKNPDRRYASAEELRQDLDRFQEGKPVLAHRAGTVRRILKWSRRNRAASVFLLTLTASLFVITAVGGWYNRELRTALDESTRMGDEAEHQRLEAEQQARIAESTAASLRQRLYPSLVRQAQQAVLLGDHERAVKLLEECRRADSGEDLRGFAWYHLSGQCHAELQTIPTSHAEVYYVEFSPDGELLATAGDDGKVNLIRTRDWQVERTLHGHTSCVNAVGFTADGKRLITGSCDTKIGIWDVASGTRISLFDGGMKIGAVAISPSETTFATGSFEQGTETVVRDLETGEPITSFLSSGQRGVPAVALMGDGERVLVSGPKSVRLMSLSQKSKTFGQIESDRIEEVERWREFTAVALSRDETTVAVATSENFNASAGPASGIHLLSIDSNGNFFNHRKLHGEPATVNGLAFSPDGRLLASGGSDRIVRIWDVATTELLAAFVGHSKRVSWVSFSPDGRMLASASFDGTVKLWPVTIHRGFLRLPVSIALDGRTSRLAFSRDGSRLMVTGRNGLQSWETASWSEESRPASHTWASAQAVACQADPSDPRSFQLAVIDADQSEDKRLVIWNSEESQPRYRLSLPDTQALAFSENGCWVAASGNGKIVVWDLHAPVSPFHLKDISDFPNLPPLTIDRDGSTFASGDGANTQIHSWRRFNSTEGSSFEHSTTSTGHAFTITDITFSPDGRYLGTCSLDGTARIYRVDDQQEVSIYFGHRGHPRVISFSSDGKTVVTGDHQGTLKVWDPQTGLELLELNHGDGPVSETAFSPDGTKLASVSVTPDGHGEIMIWFAPRP